MNNIKRYSPKCQAQKENYFITKCAWDPLLNSVEYISSRIQSEQAVFNVIVQEFLKRKHCYLSQKEIATRAKVGFSTAKRAIANLFKAKLLIKIGKYQDYCIYRIPEFLFHKSISSRLKYIIPALQFVFLPYLYCDYSTLFRKRDTYNYNLFINTESVSVTKLKDKLLTKRVENLRPEKRRFGDLDPDFEKKGRVVMEVYGQEPPIVMDLIPEAVEKFKSLELTVAGKVRLSAFPDAVMREIDAVFSRKQGIKEPMAYIFKAALRICDQRNITPDWERKRYLQKHLRVSDNSPCYINYVFKPAQAEPWMKHKSSAISGNKTDASMNKYGAKQDESRLNSNHSAESEDLINKRKSFEATDPFVELAKCEEQYKMNPTNFFVLCSYNAARRRCGLPDQL